MTRDPSIVQRYVVSFNGSVWPFETREQAWVFLANRWNLTYADEDGGEEGYSGDFPMLTPATPAEDRPGLDTLCLWFRAQFDQVHHEELGMRLTVTELRRLAEDEIAFQEWRATGTPVDDLRAPELLDITQMYPEDHPEPQPGIVYADCCSFVEGPGPDGEYGVNVSNLGYTDTDLELVERFLWDMHARTERFYAANVAFMDEVTS